MATSAEEIDIFELLANIIRVIRTNLIPLIVAFILGSGLGLIYYQISPNLYESRLFISSDILTESYSKSVIDNLVKLIKEENDTALAKKLNLPPEVVSKLADMQIIAGVEKYEGLETGRTYFYIEVKSTDNSNWKQLQEAIIGHLQSNEFVRIRVEQRRKLYTQMIEKMNLELTDLEKLKDRITSGSFAQSDKGNLVLFDPTNVNTKILEINKEKINLQNALETVNSVQIVEGFTTFKKPVAPKLSLSVVAGSSVGILFACLYIALQAFRAMLKFS